LLARYLRIQWNEFHQTLVDDVVEVNDEQIRFRKLRGQGRGHYKVRCENFGTPVSCKRLKSIAIRFGYVIEYDAKMIYLRHEGHKVLKARSNQGHV